MVGARIGFPFFLFVACSYVAVLAADVPGTTPPVATPDAVETVTATPSAAEGSVIAPPDCTNCPATTDQIVQRIEALASTIEASTTRSPVDTGESLKTVFLNILSNRLDAWLFGDGKGSIGLAAQIAALLAFAIALLRLVLAIAMLNPEKPLSRWARFKAWTRKNLVVRLTNVFIAAFVAVFTGAALYVVVSARASPDIAQSSILALQDGLKTCQASLAHMSAQKPTAQPSSAPSDLLTQTAALDKLSKSCDAAIRATDGRIAQMQASVNAIHAKQPWTFTKLLSLLTGLYLIGGMTYLLVIASRN